MKNEKKPNIYYQAQRLADITKQLIVNGNVKRAQYFLQKAETLFTTGTPEIKSAISNVYLFSLSSFMEIRSCNIKGLLPDRLLAEYYRQINASGI